MTDYLAMLAPAGAALLILAAADLSDQTGSVPSMPASALRLTVKITDAKYCRGSYRDTAILQLRISAVISNVSDRNVVVYDDPVVTRITIAANDAELIRGNQEAEMEPSTISTGDSSQIAQHLLRTVKPHSDARIDIPLVLPIPVLFGVGKSPGYVGPGDHVARIRLETWPADDPRVLSNWVRRLGPTRLLLTESIASQPFVIIVEKNPRLLKCD